MQVGRVKRDQVRALADAITRGFMDNEVWVWMIPDERRRSWLLRRYYRALIPRVAKRAEVWSTADAQGGSIWFPWGTYPFTRAEQFLEAYALAPGGLGVLRRGAGSDETMQTHHPHEPHHYLMVLSVDPDHQRGGYGGALMRPMLERCDSEQMPCYLETNRESNIPYYARFGFELTKEVEIPDGPPLWLMWREPRP